MIRESGRGRERDVSCFMQASAEREGKRGERRGCKSERERERGMLAYAGVCRHMVCKTAARDLFFYFFFISCFAGVCRHLVCKTAAREVLAPGHIKMVAEEGILSLLALLVQKYKY